MKTRKNSIVSKAIEILESEPSGVRYSELVEKIHKAFPTFPVNTIHGTVYDLQRQLPNDIYKPERGLFQHVKFKKKESEESRIDKISKIKEEQFYQPFANWLEKEMQECTKAIVLGGNKFKDKWGTPDVIGKRESQPDDIIKFTTEFVSAEIKYDTSGLIEAFGQACSYLLFSSMSYMVIPKNSSKADILRLNALCLIFGIGLVLFDNTNVENPNFEIRVRPSKYEPDMFYVNEYAKRIKKELWG